MKVLNICNLQARFVDRIFCLLSAAYSLFASHSCHADVRVPARLRLGGNGKDVLAKRKTNSVLQVVCVEHGESHARIR